MNPTLNIPSSTKPRVVIVGCGFGGLSLAKGLRRSDFQVVIIDRNNYHTFQPLLYQVATGGVEPGSIAYPIRKIFRRNPHIHFRLAEALELGRGGNILHTDHGDLRFDYLVMATGAQTNYFGMRDFADRSLPMKGIDEALDLRSVILRTFEDSLLHQNDASLTAFAVIGGGPTGVELAGALAEFRKVVLPADYPELARSRMKIFLIEMQDRVLAAMSEEASKHAALFLHRLGVELLLKARVRSFDGRFVHLEDGRRIATRTVLWTAGTKGSPLANVRSSVLGKGGRVLVDRYNRVQGYDDIFAVGDVAAMVQSDLPQGHPMLAPVAIQQGALLANNLQALLRGRPLTPFRYHDRGTMATVGRHKAVADFPRLRIQGTVAWLLWVVVHLMQLIGFRNKAATLLDWTWSYFTYDRNIRLILPPLTARAARHPLSLLHNNDAEERELRTGQK